MSVWSTRNLGRYRDYIVLRHSLRGINYTINGVKFRNSYAVVEKDSKVHKSLKRLPVLKSAKEFPLTHLRNLKFVTRTQDIRAVFGQDVYTHFLQAEAKQKEIEAIAETQEAERLEAELQAAREAELVEKARIQAEIEALKAKEEELKEKEKVVEISKEIEELESSTPDISKCAFRTPKGDLCKHDAAEFSPSNYCLMHLLSDEKLIEFGIEVPKYMDKQKKRSFKKATINKLKKLKKDNQF